jgi:hypothetical protein
LKVSPAGSVSVTVSVPVVADVPGLLTAIVYVPVAPTVKLPVCVFVIASTGVTTVVGSVAAGVFAAPPPDAFAVFVTLAGALAATCTVSVIALPEAAAAIAVALVHVTTPPAALHVHPVPLAALKVKPVGSVSVTVSVPDVARFPELLTTSAYVPVCPATNEPVWDFASASTGAPESVVGSVAVGAFEAPPPLTVTELVREPAAPATFTMSVMGLPLPEAAMLVTLVHVAVWPEPPHVHPVPEAALKVSPAGSVSVTVSVPVVADVPELLTTIAYVPVEPLVKLPVCDFAIARTGVTTVVGSVATGVFAAPPPEAFAELVTVAGAFPATFTVSAIAAALPATAMGVALVQLTTAPAAPHVHPTPLAALKLNPPGNVSVTVIVPDVATLPVLPTFSAYVPVCPATNEPV